MNERTLRDHSQPCEHGHTDGHIFFDGNRYNFDIRCPGGREILLREITTIVGVARPLYVEVHEGEEDMKWSGFVGREVPDE